MSINDGIKRYICKINYNPEEFESNGSGVIVNIKNDDYFYILTAKHTFFTHTNNEEMDENEIFKEKIKIVDYKNETLLLGNESILEVIGIDKQYDFLIFVIKKENQVKGIDALFIYEDDFKECKICGYPNSKLFDKNKIMLLPCSYSTSDEEKSTYEVNSNILLEALSSNLNANEKMKGISGSGVFVESATSKIYLAGIQIATASHNALVCLDIRILAKEINEALTSYKYNPIPIDGYVVKDELGINTDELNFGEMLNKLKDEVFDKQGLKDKSYTEILKAFNESIKQNLEQSSKELANKYLYLSLLFHREKDNRRSTIYFKKAVKNNPSYYALFLKAKDERDLTEKEQEKYDEINLEVSNSDVSTDDLFLEMLEDKLKKLEEFDEKEGVYIQMIKLLETQLRELKHREDIDEVKEKIYKKSIELFELYVDDKKLDNADRLLLDLQEKKYDIGKELYQLYTEEAFITQSSSSKQELSKRYLDLLDRFKDDKEKFRKLREQLDLLYNDKTNNVVNELQSVKKKMKNHEEQVSNLVDIFTQYIQDEKVLKRVDGVSKEIKNSHVKLDNISKTVNKNHKFLIKYSLDEVSKTNRKLVARVQKIYSLKKDDLEKIYRQSTQKIEYEVKDIPNLDNDGYIKNIQKVVNESNNTLYKNIQKLYIDNENSLQNNFLKEALILAEKEHKEHLVSLKKLVEDKNKQIVGLEQQIKKLTVEYKNSKNKSIEYEESLLDLQQRYKKFKQEVSKNSNELSDIDKINYEEEIEKLNKLIEQLKGKNNLIDDLQESIELSSKTADRLVDLSEANNVEREGLNEILRSMDSNISTLNFEPIDKENFEQITKQLDTVESKIDDIDENYFLLKERFNKILSNPKNQQRLKEITNQVKSFEEILKRIEKDVKPEITLHFAQTHLEKIEEQMQKSRFPVYGFYCRIRAVSLGSILLGTLIIVLLNEPFKSLISSL